MKNNDIINTFFVELQNAKNNVLYCLEHPNGSVNFLGLEHWAGCVARLQKEINDIMFPALPLMLPAPIKKSTRNEKLPAVKERKPRAKHSALCRSMLKNMSKHEKGKLIKYGVNLADPSLTVCPKSNKQSTARILKEAQKEGYSVVLVEIYPSYNSLTTHFAWLVEGDKWGSDTTKGIFDEYRRDANTKLYLVKSKTYEVTENDNNRYYYGYNYDPFERLGRPGHDPWMQIGVHIDKSGYRLVNLESRKQEAHRYCADVRRKQEEAAFNTADREKTLTEANRTLTETRMKIAEYIIENNYVPTIDFWYIGRALRTIENAKTDNELKEGINEFNEALTNINNLLTPKAA